MSYITKEGDQIFIDGKPMELGSYYSLGRISGFVTRENGLIDVNGEPLEEDRWYRINVVYPRAPLWRRLARLIGAVTRIRRLRWVSFTEGEPESVDIQREDSC